MEIVKIQSWSKKNSIMENGLIHEHKNICLITMVLNLTAK